MRRSKRVVVWIIVIMLTGYTVIQVIGWGRHDSSPKDATGLLLQVALFQMELLASYTQHAAGATHTGELDALKTSAYSVQYTHERLAMALGEKQAPPLESANWLLQIITRMQIGGDRALRKPELDFLKGAAPKMQELFEAYREFADGTINASKADAVRKLDDAFVKWVRKQTLQ